MNISVSVRRVMGLLLTSAFAFAADCAAVLGAQSQAFPEIPLQGKGISDFVPPGWSIFKQADGYLNGDKIVDHALILVKQGDNPEAGCQETGFSKLLRPVIVLHGEPGGGLKRVCLSPGAVMNGQVANNFALLAVGIDILKGNIVVSNGNGATQVAAFDSKYRWQNDRYELIGLSESTACIRDNSSHTRDTNLNTSNTDVSDSSGGDPDTGKGSTDSAYSYYGLRAGLVETPPAMDGVFKKEEWPGPVVELKRRVNLAAPKGSWHGPADFSAELYGVHTATDLFLCAKVTDKTPDKAVSIKLFGGGKNIYLPQQCNVQLTKDGEFIEARFPLSSLKKAKALNYSRLPLGYDALDLSVRIVEPGKDGAPNTVLSTSCDKEKHSGMVLLTRSAALPTLENWDWALRDQ